MHRRLADRHQRHAEIIRAIVVIFSASQHLIARPRYQVLGCTEYHDNCADNFRMALMAIGEAAVHVPDPFNLWMNIPVSPQGPAARPECSSTG